MLTPARLLRFLSSALTVLAAATITVAADITLSDLSQLKVTPLPFPDLNATSVHPLSVEEIQSRANILDQTLGNYPPQFKHAEDRQGIYAVWSEVLAAALALEASQGDSEPVMHALAALYREGHNLDVQECALRASTLLESGLKKFPNSIPLNFEAAHFYIGIGQAAPAEKALLHLRELRHTTTDLEIEHPLLFAYLYQNKRKEALQQVDHCLALRPGDPFYLKTRQTLSSAKGFLRIRVPMGSPNELTLKGDPTFHFALDRHYDVTEIKPTKSAPEQDLRAYVFVPADGQSAANLTLGSDAHFLTEDVIASMHEGAKVAKVKARFNDEEIVLWHYRDSHHLYSTFWFVAVDAAGKSKRVEIDLIANTPQRLEALEKGFSLIDML